MKAKGFYSLSILLFALTLAGACGAGNKRKGVSANRSLNAGGNTPGNGGGVSSKLYSDPDHAFTVRIPGGWRIEREEKDGAYMTVIRPEQYRAANISILTIKAAPGTTGPPELKSHMLVESSKPFFQGWINGLREQARVEVTRGVHPTRLDKFDALGLEVDYYRGDADDPRKGHCVFLIGDKTTFFIALTGSLTRFEEMEEIISTASIEP